MKGFFKFLGAVAAIFAAVVSALAVFDKISNRNAIKGEYLNCGDDSEENK